jgi:transaldolase / glucose-6-phosphate isomerase
VTVPAAQLVERIWERDPTVWTGTDEAKWLGWLDEPSREIDLSAVPVGEYAKAVLLGMGGSSLAPEVFRRSFGAESFHVLDTTHPNAIRRLQAEIDPENTFFVASSKSGTTLETRSHLDHFWGLAGREPEQFAVVTDPGSELEALAKERGFRAVFHGEPTIGGRYSALSAFGLVAAALCGADVERLRERAREMAESCHAQDSPGAELGLRFGVRWMEGRDKICIDDTPGGFGLWAEQLVAESTGKEGKGLVPAPGESPEGPDRQHGEVRVGDDPYDLGAEMYRWEFAIAIAGAILEINPFNQPDVQAAKDKTNEILAGDGEPDVEPRGSVDDLLAGARERDYVCIQAFVDPTDENERRILTLVERIRSQTGLVTTHGFGPRYLHSTGQLHKGGPPIGNFIQILDDTGEEIPIPGKPFGFGRLIRAQAAGDLSMLEERGRPIVRVRLEDI